MLVEIFESDMMNGSKFSENVSFHDSLPDWDNWVDYIDDLKKTQPRGRMPHQISSGRNGYMIVKDEIHSLIEMFDYRFASNINFPPRASKPMPIGEHIVTMKSYKIRPVTGCFISFVIDKEDLVNMVLVASTDLQIEFVESIKKVINLKNTLAIYQ